MRRRKLSHTETTSIDEGLQKTGTAMSQIPTYVTSVPNGTEKVNGNSVEQEDHADSGNTGTVSSR